jgi:hypothetical protein
MDPAFRFTATDAVKALPVLDIMVTIDDVHGIRTDRYSKPTDKRTLLDGNSDHPTHVKSGVARGVGLRMKRLASEDSWCIKNLIEEAWVLLGRGHSREWIVKGFARALIQPRLEMLEERTKENKEEKNIVRCVVPYDRALKFRENFRLLQREKKALELVQGGEFLRSFQCQLVFKNKKNLHRLILNKNPGSTREREHYAGLTTCNCLFCQRIGPETTHPFFPTELKSPWTRIPASKCTTDNLVYLAGCRDCGVIYVGETGNTLKDRCNRHAAQPGDRKKLQSLRRKPDEQRQLLRSWSAVRAHFAETGHQKLFAAPLQVLNPETTDLQRKKCELEWINRFQRRADCQGRLLNS